MTLSVLDRATDHPALSRATVLYLEAGPADVALMAHYVAECGDVGFSSASSVDEAIALARAAPPTVMLIDLDLVDASSGIDPLERLRTLPELRGTLLVALSGTPNPRARTLARHLGFHGFVAKPIKLAELGKVLAPVLPVVE